MKDNNNNNFPDSSIKENLKVLLVLYTNDSNSFDTLKNLLINDGYSDNNISSINIYKDYFHQSTTQVDWNKLLELADFSGEAKPAIEGGVFDVDRIVLGMEHIDNTYLEPQISTYFGNFLDKWLKDNSHRGLITLMSQKLDEDVNSTTGLYNGIAGNLAVNWKVFDKLNYETNNQQVFLSSGEYLHIDNKSTHGSIDENSLNNSDTDNSWFTENDPLVADDKNGKLSFKSADKYSYSPFDNLPYEYNPMKVLGDASDLVSLSVAGNTLPIAIGKNYTDMNGNIRHDQLIALNISIKQIEELGSEYLALKEIFTNSIGYAGYAMGCIDNTAINYDKDAIKDDGSCRYANIVLNNDLIIGSEKYPNLAFTNESFEVEINLDVFDEIRPSHIIASDLLGDIELTVDSTNDPHYGSLLVNNSFILKTATSGGDTNSMHYGKSYDNSSNEGIVEASDSNHQLYDLENSNSGAYGFDHISWKLTPGIFEKTEWLALSEPLTDDEIIKLGDNYKPPISDTNDPEYGQVLYGWEKFEYNLELILPSLTNDSNHTDYDKDYIFYFNVKLEDINDTGSILKSEGRVSNKDHTSYSTVTLQHSLPFDLGLPGYVSNGEENSQEISQIALKLTSHDYKDTFLTPKINFYKNPIVIKNVDDVDYIVKNIEVNMTGVDIYNVGKWNIEAIMYHDDDEVANIKQVVKKDIEINVIACSDSNAFNYDSSVIDGIIDNTFCEYLACTDSNADNYGLDMDGHEPPNSNHVDLVTSGDQCYAIGCSDSNASNYIDSNYPNILDDGSCSYRNVLIEIFRNNLDHVGVPYDDGKYIIFKNIDLSFNIKVSGNVDDGSVAKLQISNSDTFSSYSEIEIPVINGELVYSNNHSFDLGRHFMRLEIDNESVEKYFDTTTGQHVSYPLYESGNADDPDHTGIAMSEFRCSNDKGILNPILSASLYDFSYSEGSNTNNNINVDINKFSLDSNNNLIFDGLTPTFEYPEIESLFEDALEEGHLCPYHVCSNSNYAEYVDTSEYANTIVDDSLCLTDRVDGCMDQSAFNYNPSANYDPANVNCLYITPVLGCMDEQACNYDSNANVSSTCYYINLSISEDSVLLEENTEFIEGGKFHVDEISTKLLSINDPDNHLHVHLSTFEIENSNWLWEMQGSNQFKLSISISGKKEILINNEQRGTWEFYEDNIKYTKLPKLSSNTNDVNYSEDYIQSEKVIPYNFKFVIDDQSWFMLVDSDKNVENDLAYNVVNGNFKTILYDMPTGRIAFNDEFKSCHVNYVQLINKYDTSKLMSVLVRDSETNEMILTDKIYNSNYFVLQDNLDNLEIYTDDTKFSEKVNLDSKFIFDLVSDTTKYDNSPIVLDSIRLGKRYSGCNDSNFLNYDSNVTYNKPFISINDGSCVEDTCNIFDTKMGSMADNYDSNCGITKNCDPLTNSCNFVGCLDSYANNYDADAIEHDISLCIFEYCDDSNANNYIDYGYDYINSVTGAKKKIVSNSLCTYFGCIEPNADNYNENASVTELNPDRWNCFYSGCMDTNACNYDETATNHNSNLCKFTDLDLETTNPIQSTKEWLGTQYVLSTNGKTGQVNEIGNEGLQININTSALKSSFTNTNYLDGADREFSFYWYNLRLKNDVTNRTSSVEGPGTFSIRADRMKLFKNIQNGSLTKKIVNNDGIYSINSTDDSNDPNFDSLLDNELNINVTYDALVSLPLDNLGDIGFGEGIYDENYTDETIDGAQVKWTYIPFDVTFHQEPTEPLDGMNGINRYFMKLSCSIKELAKRLDLQDIYIDYPDDALVKASYTTNLSFGGSSTNFEDQESGWLYIQKINTSANRVTESLLAGECLADFFELSIFDENDIQVGKSIKHYTNNPIKIDNVLDIGLKVDNTYKFKIELVNEYATHIYNTHNSDLVNLNKLPSIEFNVEVLTLGCSSTNHENFVAGVKYLEYTWNKGILTNLSSCYNSVCLDHTASNYDSTKLNSYASGETLIADMELCKYEGYGVMDSLSCNYDPDATRDLQNISAWGEWKLFGQFGLDKPTSEEDVVTEIVSVTEKLGGKNHTSQTDGFKLHIKLSDSFYQTLIDENLCGDTNATNYNSNISGAGSDCVYLSNENQEDIKNLYGDELLNLYNEVDDTSKLLTNIESTINNSVGVSDSNASNYLADIDPTVDIDLVVENELYNLKIELQQQFTDIKTEYDNLIANILNYLTDTSQVEIEAYLDEQNRLNNLSGICGQSELNIWGQDINGNTQHFVITKQDIKNGTGTVNVGEIKLTSGSSDLSIVLNNLTLIDQTHIGIGSTLADSLFNRPSANNSISIYIGKPGCNDTNADGDTYDPEATENDGSCYYYGCMDKGAHNYDSINTHDDGSCIYYYCDDISACNYGTQYAYNKFNLQVNSLNTIANDDICRYPDINVTDLINSDKDKDKRIENEDYQISYGIHYVTDLLRSTVTQDNILGTYRGIINVNGVERTIEVNLDQGNAATLQVSPEGATTPFEIFPPVNLGGFSWNQERQTTIGYPWNLKIVDERMGSMTALLTLNNMSNSVFNGYIVTSIGVFETSDWIKIMPDNSIKRSKGINQLLATQCESVISIGLFSGNELIQNIYSTTEDLMIPAKYAIAGEPINFSLKGLDEDKNSVGIEKDFLVRFYKNGCTDETSVNYTHSDYTINNDSLCVYHGCMDSTACNYHPLATHHDPETDPCDYEICKHCEDTNACNYDDYEKNREWSWHPTGSSKQIATNVSHLCKFTDSCGDCNYKHDEDGALHDDWEQACKGCTHTQYDTYDENATAHRDDLCAYIGCTDNSANNYNINTLNNSTKQELLNIDSDNCEFEGCTDVNACNYDSIANVNVGCLYPSIENIHIASQPETGKSFEVQLETNVFRTEMNNINILGKWTHEYQVDGVNYVQLFEFNNNGQVIKHTASGVETGTWELSQVYDLMEYVLVGSVLNKLSLEQNIPINELKYNLVMNIGNELYYAFVEDYYETPVGYITKFNKYIETKDFFRPKSVAAKAKLSQPESDKKRIVIINNELPEYNDNDVKDIGAYCSIEKLDYELFLGDSSVLSGSITQKTLDLTVTTPGEYKLKLLGNLGNDFDGPSVENEKIFTVYKRGCGLSDAINYDEHTDSSLLIGVQNNLVKNISGHFIPNPQFPDGGECDYNVCDNINACNYTTLSSDSYLVNDVVCLFPEYGFDCTGTVCTLELDCNGVCGGNSVIDCNGDCDGNAFVHSVSGECVGGKTGLPIEKGCGQDSNACNYNPSYAIDELNNDKLCIYPDTNEDCYGNCLEGATKDCAGNCNYPDTTDYKVIDSCGICGGNGSMCEDVELEIGWNNIGTDLRRQVNILDNDKLIKAVYTWTSNGYEEVYDLENIPPVSALWIRSDGEGSIKILRKSLFELNSETIDMSTEGLNDPTSSAYVEIIDLELNKDTVINTSYIGQTIDEVDMKLIVDSSTSGAQEALFFLENIPMKLKNNQTISSIWLKIDFSSINIRFFNVERNAAGTIGNVVASDGSYLTNRNEAKMVPIGFSEKEIWIKVNLKQRDSVFNDTNHPDYGNTSKGNDLIMSIERTNASNQAVSASAIGSTEGNIYISLIEPINVTIDTTIDV